MFGRRQAGAEYDIWVAFDAAGGLLSDGETRVDADSDGEVKAGVGDWWDDYVFFSRPAAFITTMAKEVARYNAMNRMHRL